MNGISTAGVRYDDWMNAYKAEWSAALAGKKTVDQAMRDASAQVNRILKGN